MRQHTEFTELYKTYSPAILKICLGYTGERNQAEDLLQEVFLSVWNNMSKFRQESSWKTWIYRIAVNTCLTYLRKKKLSTVDIDQHPVAAVAEEVSSREQEIQLLYVCISKLPESERLIISMVLEEQTYEEIAGVLGISPNNLRVKVHRIKKQLTEIYNQYAGL